MSNSLTDLLNQYNTQDQALDDFEQKIVAAKAERSRIAKEILDLQGDKPFTVDGKELVVANMKGTYFLRTPFGNKKKAATATA